MRTFGDRVTVLDFFIGHSIGLFQSGLYLVFLFGCCLADPLLGLFHWQYDLIILWLGTGVLLLFLLGSWFRYGNLSLVWFLKRNRDLRFIVLNGLCWIRDSLLELKWCHRIWRMHLKLSVVLLHHWVFMIRNIQWTKPSSKLLSLFLWRQSILQPGTADS